MASGANKVRYHGKAHEMCIHSDCNVEPWWLTLADIVGAEDDDDSSSDDAGDDDSDDDSDDSTDDSGDDSDDSGDDSDDDDDDDSEDEGKKAKYSDEDIANLKSALKKERATKRQLQKDLKAAKKNGTSDSKDKKDDDTKDEDTGPSEKERRLAAKLLDQQIDSTIVRVARKSKINFADMDDVMALVNRRAIEADQDEDDPTDIEIDEDTVLDELKRLGKKKHLLASTKQGPPKSGSKIKGKNNSGELSDEDLRKRYPALRSTR